MGRLTLRLPGTLHRQLKTLAENEGISLNQYIVYALTRQSTLAYTVQPLSEQAVKQQRAAYTCDFAHFILGQTISPDLFALDVTTVSLCGTMAFLKSETSPHRRLPNVQAADRTCR